MNFSTIGYACLLLGLFCVACFVGGLFLKLLIIFIGFSFIVALFKSINI